MWVVTTFLLRLFTSLIELSFTFLYFLISLLRSCYIYLCSQYSFFTTVHVLIIILLRSYHVFCVFTAFSLRLFTFLLRFLITFVIDLIFQGCRIRGCPYEASQYGKSVSKKLQIRSYWCHSSKSKLRRLVFFLKVIFDFDLIILEIKSLWTLLLLLRMKNNFIFSLQRVQFSFEKAKIISNSK